MTAVEFLTFGELPSVRIHAPGGAQATVSLFGAHLVSWIPADGKERLFCSAKSAKDGTKAIRGGVPIIFPQFSTHGKGPRHGFARLSNWRLTASGLKDDHCFAEFELSSDDPLPHAWPHQFTLTYRIELHATELHMHLRVCNTGGSEFSFAAALHTYFQIDELSAMTLDGLLGAPYSDHIHPQPQFGTQSSPLLTCSGHMDRIYRSIPGGMTMSCGEGKINLEQDGFVDAVVWNPGASLAQEVGDLGIGEHLKFICIEAARLEACELTPGTEWLGVHKLRCVD